MAGGKRDWRRAKRFAATEEKYEPGKVLDSGRVVSSKPRDSLEARARAAEQRWLQQQGLKKL